MQYQTLLRLVLLNGIGDRVFLYHVLYTGTYISIIMQTIKNELCKGLFISDPLDLSPVRQRSIQ